MLPPPFQRSSMTRPSLWRNSAELFLELRQRGLVHRLDVQVADAAAGELVDHGAPLFHPAVVAEVAERRHRDRLVLDLPGALGLGLVIERQLDLAVEPAAQERVVKSSPALTGLPSMAIR